MNLLLVEDNHGDALLIKELLSDIETEFDVAHMTRLSAALQHLRTSQVDAILLDLTLPDSTGVRTLQRVHERAPEIAIVVLTGFGDDELAQLAIRSGAQDFFQKAQLDGGALARAIHHATVRARMQSRMRAVVERNADGLVVINRDSVIRYVNPAAQQMFERTEEELLGEVFGFPIESPSRSEVQIVTRRDEPLWAELRVTDFEWHEEPAYLVSLRDVTDRKRADALQVRLMHADRLASIGQLAAGVAHEINNPAAFISANLSVLGDELGVFRRSVEALLSGEAPTESTRAALSPTRFDEMADIVEENLQGIERIVRIVRDLRSFSRVEQNEVELVDVNEVLSIACNMTFNEIRHRAALVRDFSPLPLIAADRGKLTQLFTNLIMNAAQALDDDEEAHANEIRIASAVAGERVVVSVRDTGCGMDAEVRQRIFEPFFTTKPREIGTGLGLALSAEIVRKHGGELRVESEVGRGTTVEVALPLETALAAGVSRPPQTPIPEEPYVRARVLVIDDEDALLRAFGRLLGTRHDVVKARGGAAGLACVRSDLVFDVIICDLMMPEVDGIAVYEGVAALDPSLANRIVFCTGGAFTPRAKQFIEEVGNICLEKPVQLDRLLRVINQLCSPRRRADPEA